MNAGGQHAGQERTGQGSTYSRGKIVRGPAQRTYIASQLFGRGRDQHVEQQRHKNSFANAGHKHAENYHECAPVIPDDHSQ